jgi:hypothetical protein
MLLSLISPVVVACPPAAGAATVSLEAKMRPLQLGRSTTVSVAFAVAAGGAAESPLTEFDVRMPAGIGLATSTLGFATCSAGALEASGPDACPANSVMGFGRAEVEAPFGSQSVLESAPISIFMTSASGERTTMLLYVDGRVPVIAPFVLSTQVVSPANTLDSELDTAIPPIATAPEAGDVLVRQLQLDIGPRGVTYYKRVRGRIVGYRPVGLSVPNSCPRGGFVFHARFRFQDGVGAHARSVVPCPRGAPRGARTRHRGRRS